MFERYTESARRSLFFARYEVTQLGSISIEPEHLLLGLLRDSRAISVLVATSLEGLRAEIEKHVVVTEKVSTSVEVPFSAGATRVLQFAAPEADGMRHAYIGSEHLLLGVLREEQSVAASALAGRGVRLRDVRCEVEKLRGSLDASPQAYMQMALDRIKNLVDELARTPRDGREAGELLKRIHESLDALPKGYGMR
jgi:ATP-dependent Clp protease ATP-binding subunit ClpC